MIELKVKGTSSGSNDSTLNKMHIRMTLLTPCSLAGSVIDNSQRAVKPSSHTISHMTQDRTVGVS